MTREQEIEQAMKDSVAATIYAGGWGMTPQVTDLLQCAFTKGAEWADNNPKDGTVSLEKVEKYLRENIMMYYYSKTFDEQEKWFDDFRKVMKE